MREQARAASRSRWCTYHRTAAHQSRYPAPRTASAPDAAYPQPAVGAAHYAAPPCSFTGPRCCHPHPRTRTNTPLPPSAVRRRPSPVCSLLRRMPRVRKKARRPPRKELAQPAHASRMALATAASSLADTLPGCRLVPTLSSMLMVARLKNVTHCAHCLAVQRVAFPAGTCLPRVAAYLGS